MLQSRTATLSRPGPHPLSVLSFSGSLEPASIRTLLCGCLLCSIDIETFDAGIRKHSSSRSEVLLGCKHCINVAYLSVSPKLGEHKAPHQNMLQTRSWARMLLRQLADQRPCQN